MNAQELAARPILVCKKGSASISDTERNNYLQQLPRWSLIEYKDMPMLERSFDFKSFAEALTFTNRIGVLAEAANHHPALLTEWGKVTVCWWTHTIGGLHLNDFIMAARSDKVYRSMLP